MSERQKEWRLANPERELEHHRRWRQNNRERSVGHLQTWRQLNPERAVIHARRSAVGKYGLTLEQYDRRLESQGGVCALCGETNASGQSLGVDHDHKTGAARGLLCLRCNNTLAHAEAQPPNAIRFALYLGEHLGKADDDAG